MKKKAIFTVFCSSNIEAFPMLLEALTLCQELRMSRCAASKKVRVVYVYLSSRVK